MLNRNNWKHILVLILGFFLPSICSASHKIYFKKTCTDSNTVRVIYGISLENCVEECQRRKRCSEITYRHGINECKLKNSLDWSSLTEKEPLCVYANVAGWLRDTFDTCSKNECRRTQKCETRVRGKRFKCVTTECPKSHRISHAQLFSKVYVVGYRNGYKCEKGFFGVGDPFITCTNNGTWTPTNFTCIRRGNEPKKSYRNGKLTSVVGKKWIQGTAIHFQCRPDFQRLGANATSMINGHGEWEPKVVQCCNGNSTYIWEDKCFAIFNGSVAGSRAVMESFCKCRGGDLAQLKPEHAERIFGSGPYLWLMNKIKKRHFINHNTLTACLAENVNSDDLQNFSNYTYDSLVVEIVSRNFTGQYCDSARWWAPGQPDGGSIDKCILYNHVDSKMHDAPCDLNSQEMNQVGFVCDYNLPLI